MFQHIRNIYSAVLSWIIRQNFDPYVVISICIILILSLICQSSVADGQFLMKHMIYIVLGLFVFYTGFSVNSDFIRHISWLLYIFAVLLLIYVSFQGTESLGAQRWIKIGSFSMQPSEPAKLACILMLAYVYAHRPPTNILSIIGVGFLVVFVPFLLILSQPDLGTSIVLVVIFVAISYWAGAKFMDLFILFNPAVISLIASLGVGISIVTVSLLGREVSISASYWGLLYLVASCGLIFWVYRIHLQRYKIYLWSGYTALCMIVAFVCRPIAWSLLATYQQKRLTIFLDPYSDSQGAGYNIIQSLLAVGSGQAFGQGYGNGQLTQGKFVPEQHTDFIFSSFAEEFGFIGAIFLIACFIVIMVRLIYLASLKTVTTFERSLVIGIFTFLFFHVVVNISMNIGLLPITGVPLPLMSYGGTAIWSCLFSLGVAQRIFADQQSQGLFTVNNKIPIV